MNQNSTGQKAIYKMNLDCGRMGSLEGIFVTDPPRVKQLIESKEEVYFGEVLGKHSEVTWVFDGPELTLVSDDAHLVQLFEENNLSSGYNPFDYI